MENVLLTQGESSATSKASLVLANGMIFEGESVGAQGTAYGELVFNTSMVGYQEILTDPGCAEQVIVMTYPEMGNYGVNKDDFESRRVYAKGFIMKNCCEKDSHYKSVQTLSDYLVQNNIIAISNIDTRTLTKIITEYGEMSCAITTEEITPDMKKEIANFKTGKDVAIDVSAYRTEKIYGSGISLAIIDMGIKRSTLKYFKDKDCNMTIYPANTDAQVILNDRPDALLLSDGPGHPQDAAQATETIKKLLGKLPIFGICLGHQIVSTALGAKTYKLKYGHRGANHPIIDTQTNKVFLTSQNHGWAVADDPEFFKDQGLDVTHRNLNDGTIEGLKSEALNVESVQFTTETAPGEYDVNKIFENWIKKVENKKCQKI
ncbi:carbamoyl-phosphate synthase small subunit [Candidatus Gastranaerophilus sp. (ex Termes propinquus)]|nr:carbamoyl-phosphate synthase small subunit [Candidatus Gastranaerophilus sp. (ex Termes propinquus)]